MTTKNKAFEWNAETTSKATELYNQLVEDHGIEAANKSLDGIAKELGAKSGAAVRSKLSSEKVYQKPATKRKVGGSNKVPKISYIRALQGVAAKNNVELNARNLESLESATVADIQDMIKIVEAVTGEPVKVAGLEAASEPKQPKAETAKA